VIGAPPFNRHWALQYEVENGKTCDRCVYYRPEFRSTYSGRCTAEWPLRTEPLTTTATLTCDRHTERPT